MSTKNKLIDRFKKQPKDFTFEELIRLLGCFGFEVDNKGKTSGSRVEFCNGKDSIFTHKPHPSSIIKETALKDIYAYLVDNKYIKTQ
jgi:hypothetical protein